ncbi:Bg selectin 1 [Biomphalaria glabrata]|uniref:Uncharacterized protein LOC106074979 n=1 Tax=Biomphalaria glabrata TaxID=6526 RepID=A0A9U8EKT0_BIOGL|nr:uncharacterized protein LOC106074979 [Biomphalaria glabrata]KAI8736371.1 Bg selectin 1; partial [Biomphalaria glabrata]
MCLLIYLLCLTISSITGTDNIMKLEVTPSTIKLGLTSQMEIVCSVAPDPAGNYIVLNIIISQSTDTLEPQYTDVAGVEATLEPSLYVNNSATIQGQISVTDTSYLKLNWTYPTENEAGRYQCVATLSQDEEFTVVAETTVDLEQPDFDDLFSELDRIKSYFMAETRNVTELWEKKMEGAVTAVFNRSAVFDNRMYLLSKYSNMNRNQSEAMCQFVSGYLAEIESDQEFGFVKEFFNSLYMANGTKVIVGGTDQIKEGNWLFQHSGHNVPYFSWAPGHPTNSSGDNNNDCLALDISDGYNMVDVPCNTSGQNFRSRFLCEITHSPYSSSQ